MTEFIVGNTLKTRTLRPRLVFYPKTTRVQPFNFTFISHNTVHGLVGGTFCEFVLK